VPAALGKEPISFEKEVGMTAYWRTPRGALGYHPVTEELTPLPSTPLVPLSFLNLPDQLPALLTNRPSDFPD
jgi:hypothetical protein